MTRRNLYAFTNPTGPGYPAYVSLNRDDDEPIVLTVRSKGAAHASQITLDAGQLLDLGSAMLFAGGEAVLQDDPECNQPPRGWRCTRTAKHTGPCAALPRWWNAAGWFAVSDRIAMVAIALGVLGAAAGFVSMLRWLVER